MSAPACDHKPSPHLRSKPQPLAYSVRDAAEAVGISQSKLEEVIKRDEVFVKWVDGKRVVPASELVEWLKSLPLERVL